MDITEEFPPDHHADCGSKEGVTDVQAEGCGCWLRLRDVVKCVCMCCADFGSIVAAESAKCARNLRAQRYGTSVIRHLLSFMCIRWIGLNQMAYKRNVQYLQFILLCVSLCLCVCVCVWVKKRVWFGARVFVVLYGAKPIRKGRVWDWKRDAHKPTPSQHHTLMCLCMFWVCVHYVHMHPQIHTTPHKHIGWHVCVWIACDSQYFLRGVCYFAFYFNP